MQKNQKLKTSDGTEVLLFPMSYGYVSQGMHTAAGINYNAYDLGGEYPHDNVHFEDVYAPCTMTIDYHQLQSPEYTNSIIFVSDNPVLLADGSKSRVAILMAHCDNIAEFVAKDHFEQGELCYREGTYDNGVGNRDTHLHIEITKADSNGIYKPIWNPMYLTNSIPLEQAFFTNGTDKGLSSGNRSNLDAYGFIEYNGTTSWNGWIADGDYWYYYDKGAKVTGWLRYPSTSSNWYYLDPNNEGKMVTGWLLIDGLYYYFNPKDGASNHISGLAGGQMVRSHWVAGGTKWYYVKESGVMAKSESLTINGKLYNFDSNGVCLNP